MAANPPPPPWNPYRLAVLDAVSLEAWRRIVTRALEDARKGDRAARRWCDRYLPGDDVDRAVQLLANLKAVVARLRRVGEATAVACRRDRLQT
jgi:hypothetical protein